MVWLGLADQVVTLSVLQLNMAKNCQESELRKDYHIRRKAVDFGVALLRNIQLADRMAELLWRKQAVDLGIEKPQGMKISQFGNKVDLKAINNIMYEIKETEIG